MNVVIWFGVTVFTGLILLDLTDRSRRARPRMPFVALVAMDLMLITALLLEAIGVKR